MHLYTQQQLKPASIIEPWCDAHLTPGSGDPLCTEVRVALPNWAGLLCFIAPPFFRTRNHPLLLSSTTELWTLREQMAQWEALAFIHPRCKETGVQNWELRIEHCEWHNDVPGVGNVFSLAEKRVSTGTLKATLTFPSHLAHVLGESVYDCTVIMWLLLNFNRLLLCLQLAGERFLCRVCGLSPCTRSTRVVAATVAWITQWLLTNF